MPAPGRKPGKGRDSQRPTVSEKPKWLFLLGFAHIIAFRIQISPCLSPSLSVILPLSLLCLSLSSLPHSLSLSFSTSLSLSLSLLPLSLLLSLSPSSLSPPFLCLPLSLSLFSVSSEFKHPLSSEPKTNLGSPATYLQGPISSSDTEGR